jgi:hypothetical protein
MYGGDTRYGGVTGYPNDGYGGGILNFGTLTLSGCRLSNSAKYGGAIANFGTMTVSGCDVVHNSAYDIAYPAGALVGVGEGGGIYNAGTAAALTVSGSTFSNNSPDNIFGPYPDGGRNSFS